MEFLGKSVWKILLKLLFFAAFLRFLHYVNTKYGKFSSAENIQIGESAQERIKACIFILSKESNLRSLKKTIISFEKYFNSKYNYDYVIVNNEEFNQSFKTHISKLTNSRIKFGRVPKEHWSYPAHIDQEKTKVNMEKLRSKYGPSHGKSESYRFMCRFYSGFFFKHPLVQEYEYYWRLDADSSELLCRIDFDPFQVMFNGGYEYGFNIFTSESLATIPTLWSETVKFIQKNPDIINKSSSNMKPIVNSANTYNLCQFYNNFEIASFKFFKSERYLKYFEHLEQAGGFFYERWGDAPVHTIAVSMLLPKSKVYLFEMIGYKHQSVKNKECSMIKTDQNCSSCTTDNFMFSSCMINWKKS